MQRKIHNWQFVLWASPLMINCLLSAQTSATVAAGRLTLLTPAGNQSVKVEVDNSTARVFGFPGLADGTQYTGLSGLSVQTGSGNDKVEVLVSSSQSFDVRVDTGFGEAENSLKWEIRAGASAPVASATFSGAFSPNQIVLMEVDSQAPNATLLLNSGTATEIKTLVKSSNNSSFLRVAFAGNASKSTYELESAASVLEIEASGGGTSANDEISYKIAQKRPGQVSLDWNLDAFAGHDKIEALVDAPDSTVRQRGSVFGRGGNDQINFETAGFSTVTGLTLDGGAGNDELSVIIKGRFQASQTLGPRLLGGQGDDILILTTDTGIFGSGLPNDLFPVINCGAGADRFNAFGQILGCEDRL